MPIDGDAAGPGSPGSLGAAHSSGPSGSPLPAVLSEKIRAVVVDPRPQPHHHLWHLLNATGRIEVVDTVAGGIPALDAIRRLDPDVVFIHLCSPLGSQGLDVAEAVHAHTLVVLVASDDTQALAGFRVGAVDYLVEPLDLPRITATLTRLDRLLARPPDATSSEPAAPPTGADGGRSLPVFDPAAEPLALEDRLPLTASDTRKTEYVTVGRIAWIESLENYSRVQLAGGVRLVLKRSLTVWEEILPASAFRRLGRSLIIQDGRIQSASWKGRHAHILFEGVPQPLVVGRAAATRLRKLLKPRGGG